MGRSSRHFDGQTICFNLLIGAEDACLGGCKPSGSIGSVGRRNHHVVPIELRSLNSVGCAGRGNHHVVPIELRSVYLVGCVGSGNHHIFPFGLRSLNAFCTTSLRYCSTNTPIQCVEVRNTFSSTGHATWSGGRVILGRGAGSRRPIPGRKKPLS